MTLLLTLALAAAAAGPVAPPEGPFRPASGMDLVALEQVVVARTPTLEGAALEVDLARAEARQSRLLPNPDLDLGWGTIPVGPLNPPGLQRPLAHVPNYSVGLSYTFPAGKRRHRIRRAEELRRGAEARLDATRRALSLELAGLLAQLAVATLRSDGFRHLVEGAERAVGVAEARLTAGFGTPLDVDRLRIDLRRTEQALRSAESDVSAALAACAGLLATPCEGFAGSAEARRFLAGWIDGAGLPDRPLEARPDLQALAALERAARAEERLGRNTRIPDPTLRLGYFHDRFVISGNQMNSFNLSLSLPLPIFDRGQALVDAARARQARIAAERRRRLSAAEARIAALTRRLEAQRARQHTLSDELIPQAQAVLADVERAAQTRLVSLSDVLQARKTMSELLIEEADSYADAFGAYLQLLAEFPRPAP